MGQKWGLILLVERLERLHYKRQGASKFSILTLLVDLLDGAIVIKIPVPKMAQ
jgi:hypothetical protein